MSYVVIFCQLQVDGTDCRRFKLAQVLLAHAGVFEKTLNHPQMQRLLLGPVGSTVELELRHVGEKASYSVCAPLHLLTWP